MRAFSVVEEFERAVAKHCGAPHCIATSTGTAAMFLSLVYERQKNGDVTVECPARTFISVPMAALQAGFGVRLLGEDWDDFYQLKPTRVVDSALYFASGCYLRGTLQCLSFHARKILPIGEGGAVLTDDDDAAEWLRAARYSGRSKSGGFDVQKVAMMGWQLYMTPEKAARGLHLLEYVRDLQDELPRAAMEYPDLREAPFFRQYAA